MKLGKSEYYNWHNESPSNRPQDRYLNVEFLKNEFNRIEEAKSWMKTYRAKDVNGKLDDYVAYVLPVDISKLIEKNVDERGYIIKGSSALRNNLQFPLLILFPKDVDLPEDYSLVRFIEPRKKLVAAKSLHGHYAIEVEDYEVLPAEYPYLDLPAEKKFTHNLIKENLGGDDFIARCLNSPLLSSPKTNQEPGGIGASSLTKKSDFAEELVTQLQRLLPPELREMKPPRQERQGKWERSGKGRGEKLQFKTAEQIVNPNTRVSLEHSYSYKSIIGQNYRRASFTGEEYSYMGNVVPITKKNEIIQEAVERFTQSEITTSAFNDLKEWGIGLDNLEKNINNYEDIWINLVEVRQINPSLDKQALNREKWLNKIKGDWDLFLPRMGYEENLSSVINAKAEKTLENIIRLAKANARNERRTQVTEKDLKTAHWNFKTQVDKFIENDITKDAIRHIEKDHHSSEITIIKIILKSKPCTKEELWKELKQTPQFEDKNKFNQYITRLYQNEGRIYRTPDHKLHWI